MVHERAQMTKVQMMKGQTTKVQTKKESDELSITCTRTTLNF